MKSLEMKKILFFAPSFFGYEIKIKNKMEELGAKVDMFDERSINSSFQKTILKINPNIYKKKTEMYYFNILNRLKENHYDFVFFIKCEMATTKVLEEYKKTFCNSIFCLYLYDSLQNVKNIEKKLKYFDYIYSFDRFDCKKNKLLRFEPLFYCDEYQREKSNQRNKYDLCFIGTIHSDRYKILKHIKKRAEDEGLNMYFYPFLQSKFIYYFYKLTKPEFRDTKITDFKYDKLSANDISQIVDASKVIIDIQHPNQTGLTMRTIEILGLKKKLVTTNKDIINYDFYNANNIKIIDRKHFTIDKNFINREYIDLDEKIYRKYSLSSWIETLMGDDVNEDISNGG